MPQSDATIRTRATESLDVGTYHLILANYNQQIRNLLADTLTSQIRGFVREILLRWMVDIDHLTELVPHEACGSLRDPALAAGNSSQDLPARSAYSQS